MRTIKQKIRPEDDEPVYLTPEGFERMKAKLARLKRDMPGMAEEAARTAAYGDRSDNAEYKDAKGKLRRAHAQIFDLEDKMKRVVVIKPGGNHSGTVQIGSSVVLITKTGRKTFEIVGSIETDPSKGRISHKSPLGAALIGRKKNDGVTIKTENGAQEYTILEIQ